MRVCKVTSSINLVWADVAQELNDNINISRCKVALLDTSSLIEWEV